MCVSIFLTNGPTVCEVPFCCLFIYQFLLDFMGILFNHWALGYHSHQSLLNMKECVRAFFERETRQIKGGVLRVDCKMFLNVYVCVNVYVFVCGSVLE